MLKKVSLGRCSMEARRWLVAVWKAAAVAAVMVATPGAGMAWSNIGPPGGAIVQVAVAGPEGEHVYAMTTGGSLWVSADGAVSFEERARGRFIGAVPFVVDPADPMHLWVAESEEVVESWDGGGHWEVLSSFPVSGWIGSLIVDPWVPGAVDAVFAEWGRSPTLYGMFRLLPDGRQEVLRETVGLPAGGDGVLYLANGDGMLRSADGTRWEMVKDPGVGTVTALAVDPGDGRHVLAGGGKGLAVSLDGGATWRKTEIPERVVAVTVGSGVAWCATTAGLWISTSDGLWWERTALHGDSLECLAADPSDPGTVYAGALEAPEGFDRPGLMRSKTFGQSFQTADSGIVATGVWRAFPAPGETGPKLVVENHHGLLAWDGNGPMWRALRPNGGERATAFCRDPLDGRRLFATSVVTKNGRSGDALFVSDDGGRSWQRRTGLAASSSSGLAADPSSPGLVFGAGWPGVTVFHLDDGTVECPYCNGTRLDAIVAPEALPGAAIAGGWELWRSEDSGATWQTVDPVDPSSPWDIRDLEASAGGLLYLVNGSWVFRSIDGGGTWTRRGSPRPAWNGCRDLAVSPHNPDVVVMACTPPEGTVSGWGVFLSGDGGVHWQPVDGPPGLYATTVDLDPEAPGYLLVGTASHGVWEGPLTPAPRRVRDRVLPGPSSLERGRASRRSRR